MCHRLRLPSTTHWLRARTVKCVARGKQFRTSAGVIALARPLKSGGELIVVANMSDAAATVDVPPGAAVLVSSAETVDVTGGRVNLPATTTVWLRG